MKKQIVTFVIFIFAIFNCMSQPNGGFEDWHTEASYLVPDEWQTLSYLSLMSPPNPISVFKASGLDKHSGNFALKLVTVFLNNNPLPGVFDDTIGVIFKGKISLSPPSVNYGFPYTGRPEMMEFWSKYIPVGLDKGGAEIVLRRWNGTNHDTIAFGQMEIDATVPYSKFQLTPTYYSTASPDSAIIGFSSSNNISATARVGSVLYVDDVAFTGWVGIDEQIPDSDKIKIFPNPAKDNVTIQTQIDDASTVKVLDVSGRQVGVYKIKNYNVNINTSLFAKGVYFCELLDKKERIISKGKFNVVR